MGIGSIGRSVLIRQAFLTALMIALGGYAYVDVQSVAGLARTAGGGDSQSLVGSTIAAAADSAAWSILIATAVAVLV